MNDSIAIITARGGSKRIPKKNIKEFCGKPIIAYSIEAALESKIFDEVMVSTDDQEIADIAIQYGAKVPFLRSNETSDDFATTRDVLDEVVQTYKTKLKRSFDYVCCIYPTAPFVSAKKLREAYAMLKDGKADQVIPVVQFSFPPQRCFVVHSDGKLRYKWPENQRKRSQDLEPLYHDAGQFYFFDAEVFYKQKTVTELLTTPYILSDLEVQDIDNIDDWQIAEIKYRLMQQR
ncbi:pseudaminic acid cytidylyltransferase [Phascolarctobacterium sp.]